MSASQTDLYTTRKIEPEPLKQADSSRLVLLTPAVLIVLALSLFPLVLSLFTSLTRIKFVRGGFDITFVGLKNYEKLLLGSESRHFLGKLSDLSPVAWLLLAALIGLMLYLVFRYVTGPRRTAFGLVMRVVTVVIAAGLAWIAVSALTGEGLPGTLVVTLIFVFAGVSLQYLLGLGLGLLVTQNLPGRRFFRVIFLLPMMITPVGIGFTFRMVTDTLKGPLSPVWAWLGLSELSWVDTGHGARIAILIGDVWQWTPFIFIILLAALESIPTELVEAALVDGASRAQIFRYIILPQIAPVSTTVILIRLIEAFKIIDMPQVLTNGGPGTSTESMTLHAYNLWRALDLGTSAALAYLLLFVVTFMAMVFVNFIRRSLLERV